MQAQLPHVASGGDRRPVLDWWRVVGVGVTLLRAVQLHEQRRKVGRRVADAIQVGQVLQLGDQCGQIIVGDVVRPVVDEVDPGCRVVVNVDECGVNMGPAEFDRGG